jgi:hypothetical protein
MTNHGPATERQDCAGDRGLSRHRRGDRPGAGRRGRQRGRRLPYQPPGRRAYRPGRPQGGPPGMAYWYGRRQARGSRHGHRTAAGASGRFRHPDPLRRREYQHTAGGPHARRVGADHRRQPQRPVPRAPGRPPHAAAGFVGGHRGLRGRSDGRAASCALCGGQSGTDQPHQKRRTCGSTASRRE